MTLLHVGGRWLPEGTSRTRRRRPKEGELVAYQHAAWRVIHVDTVELKDDEQARVAVFRPEYRDEYLPYRIVLRREHGPKHPSENSRKDIARRLGTAFLGFDVYETDRVPLCSCCNDPWPCRTLIAEDEAQKAARRMDDELKLLPGCCPACQEPITSRQKSITFPGENVRNPLASDPVFHLRQQCSHGACAYEEQWVKADPSRPRSLLTLFCQGSLIICGDGYAECHGAEDCPSVHAGHRSLSACYLQSHGCGRQCGSAHHGTWLPRVADWPKVP